MDGMTARPPIPRHWCPVCRRLVAPVVVAETRPGALVIACPCGRVIGELYVAAGLTYPPRKGRA